MSTNDHDSYVFTEADLVANDENVRRWAFIYISKNRLSMYEDLLLHALTVEPSESNRRHIVRALGNAGTSKCIKCIVDLAEHENGLVLGEVAEALGKLRAYGNKAHLMRLSASPLEWVANKAKWALAHLEEAKAGEEEKGSGVDSLDVSRPKKKRGRSSFPDIEDGT